MIAAPSTPPLTAGLHASLDAGTPGACEPFRRTLLDYGLGDHGELSIVRGLRIAVVAQERTYRRATLFLADDRGQLLLVGGPSTGDLRDGPMVFAQDEDLVFVWSEAAGDQWRIRSARATAMGALIGPDEELGTTDRGHAWRLGAAVHASRIAATWPSSSESDDRNPRWVVRPLGMSRAPTRLELGFEPALPVIFPLGSEWRMVVREDRADLTSRLHVLSVTDGGTVSDETSLPMNAANFATGIAPDGRIGAAMARQSADAIDFAIVRPDGELEHGPMTIPLACTATHISNEALKWAGGWRYVYGCASDVVFAASAYRMVTLSPDGALDDREIANTESGMAFPFAVATEGEDALLISFVDGAGLELARVCMR